MKFCGICGATMDQNATVCPRCGAVQAPVGQPIVQQQSAAPVQQTYPPAAPPVQQTGPYITPPPQAQGYSSPPMGYPPAGPPQGYPGGPGAPPPPKSGAGKVIAIVGGSVAALALVIVGIVFALNSGGSAPPVVSTVSQETRQETGLPGQALSYEQQMAEYFGGDIKTTASFQYDDVLFPALYRSSPHLILLDATSPVPVEALLTVEIPDFTHKLEQKITIGPLGVHMAALPAMMDGALERCNTGKNAQLNVTLTNTATGEEILHDTKTIALQSMYDMRFIDDAGVTKTYRNICSWVTPEDPIIREWQRVATEFLIDMTEGELDSFIGYQGNENVTLLQLASLFDAMRIVYGVRYNMTPVTTSGNGAYQRIVLPKDVLTGSAGLCIETAITMASAAEALTMNAFIVFVPGHAITVVELMPYTGRYVVIETTALTATSYDDIFPFIGESADVMAAIENRYGFTAIIDINSGRRDGIRPMA